MVCLFCIVCDPGHADSAIVLVVWTDAVDSERVAGLLDPQGCPENGSVHVPESSSIRAGHFPDRDLNRMASNRARVTKLFAIDSAVAVPA